MGAFIWHQWARYVAITSSLYTIWSAYWGLFYRKFFWDFIGGTLRAPGGLQPADNLQIFIQIIVKMPIIQIIAFFVGCLVFTLEMPAPFVKNTGMHRSWIPRIILLIIQAFFTALYYQGTNAAIYSIIAVFGYVNAQARGEQMEEAKSNKGKVGGA